MKKLIHSIIALLMLIATVFAQAPQSFKYQAVARDASGEVLINQQVNFQLSILEGSASGTAIYIEQHTDTTNQFGLVNLVIGNGSVLLGDFASVNWGNNTYFLKIELNGIHIGTSQLLSVPYALHSKTAETVTGTITETDPVYTASEAANITVTDISNLGNLSGVNTGDQDLSLLALKSNVLELDNTTAFIPDADYEPATKKYVDDNPPTTYSVGDFAQGGIVFWVDETEQHGLVCAKTDQSTGVRWYAGTDGYTRANGDGPYSGEANTSIIIAAQVSIGDDSSTYAARICNELQITENGKTYGDWYLPSKEELNLMYQNKSTIDATAEANGGSTFASQSYWSSTEYSSSYAQLKYFSQWLQAYYLKSSPHAVRAVRAF